MIPIAYSHRNLLVRWRTTLMTASGLTLVVATLIVMLAFLKGVRTVCAVTGQPRNVICLQHGKQDEILSQIDDGLASWLELAPEVVQQADGRPLASRELFMVLTQQDAATRRYDFLQVRGVLPVALEVHEQVRVSQGRMFRHHYREVVVGAGIARSQGIRVGDTMPIGKIAWRIVGIFEAGGSAFESEVWCDLSQLGSQFHREGMQTSVVLHTNDPLVAGEVARRLSGNRRAPVQAMTETAYYQQQAEETDILLGGAVLISICMSMGAVLGVTNTMFAAISSRTTDIAVLRLLGFSRRQILVSFLLEALLISAIGGTLGSLLSFGINGLSLNTAVGAKQVAFAFRIDGAILASAAVFTLLMGCVGGLFPALSAMRVQPIEALR